MSVKEEKGAGLASGILLIDTVKLGRAKGKLSVLGRGGIQILSSLGVQLSKCSL